MKNNIDSNFAIAILVLVSACVGFFWYLTASYDVDVFEQVPLPQVTKVIEQPTQVDSSYSDGISEKIENPYAYAGFQISLDEKWKEAFNASRTWKELPSYCDETRNEGYLSVKYNSDDDVPGGFGVEASSPKICDDSKMGGLAVGVTDYESPLSERTVGDYTFKIGVGVGNPGVPLLEAYLFDYDKGPFETIYFEYNKGIFVYTPIIDNNSTFFMDYIDDTCQFEADKLVAYFCKEGELLNEKDIRKGVAEFYRILDSFTPTGTTNR